MTAAQLAQYDQAKEAFWHALVKHNPQLALFSERYGGTTHETWEPVLLAEPRRLTPGAEPHSGVSHRVPGSRPFCLPRLPGDASAPTSIDRPSAASPPETCAAEGQKEAS